MNSSIVRYTLGQVLKNRDNVLIVSVSGEIKRKSGLVGIALGILIVAAYNIASVTVGCVKNVLTAVFSKN